MSDLTLSGLSKSFKNSKRAAVDNIDLEVGAGEFVALLGPSGCGKTTLLRLITGFLRPDRGVIRIGGTDVTKLSPHRRDIGVVYQSYALWPHLTVARNVAFGLEMRGVAKSERASRVAEMLELVGLESFGDRFPTQLSGGQQQRVALARALVIRPSVLLLDEPLSSLDANLRRQLRSQIREIQQALGVTMVFVTHDQEEALAVSDRVVLMRDGRVVQQGAGEMLYDAPSSSFAMTFMGEANLVSGVLAERDDHGACVETQIGRIHCDHIPAGVARGDHVSLGIRPDHVQLRPVSTNGARDSHWVGTGQVKAVTFLGPWVQYEVETEAGTMMARVPLNDESSPVNRAERFDRGSTVDIHVSRYAVKVFTEPDAGVASATSQEKS